MQTERPYVLSIAGFDPCSGAGVSADIKTFEQLKVYGLAVCTGLTLQTEDQFISVQWRELKEVIEEIKLLLRKYPVKAIKFGIVPSFHFLDQLVSGIKSKHPEVKIVIDPIWRSSTGFVFNEGDISLDKKFLEKITLMTPNVPELEFMSKGKKQEEFIKEFIQYSSLLLKGGHSTENIGVDTLYQKNVNEITVLAPSPALVLSGVEAEKAGDEATPSSKHGSGCVLSAAITAHLALGKDLKEACSSAKNYIDTFLGSNKSLLGYHAA